MQWLVVFSLTFVFTLGLFESGSLVGVLSFVVAAAVAWASLMVFGAPGEDRERPTGGRRVLAVVGSLGALLAAVTSWALSTIAFSGCLWYCDPKARSVPIGISLTLVTVGLMALASALAARAARAPQRTTKIVTTAGAGVGLLACLAMAVALS